MTPTTAVLLIAVLAAPTAQAMSWRPCTGEEPRLAASNVELVPDPPVIGSPATFTISATSDLEATGGTVEIAVSLGGIQIYDSVEDLCTKTACPIAPGPLEVKIVQLLPPIAPPAQYGLRVLVKDTDMVELICVDVDFELVPPIVRGVGGPAAKWAAAAGAVSKAWAAWRQAPHQQQSVAASVLGSSGRGQIAAGKAAAEQQAAE